MNPRLVLPRLRRLAGENKLFSWSLAAGLVLRLFAVLGYPGALWFAGDSYVYLGAALRPRPDLSKSVGYSFFLRALLPFHSLTLVTTVQHLFGLAIAVLLYVVLRRNGVSKLVATIAALPELLDGYIIEDEHLIMAESLFTGLLMVAVVLMLWRPGLPRWWIAVLAGLLAGYAVIVRTEGIVMLAVLALFLLLRGWSWKTVRGWALAIAFAVASVVPVGAYAAWFHEKNGHYDTTLAEGYFLWGRVSSFADCARIKPTGQQAVVCPQEPLSDRTPPGNFIWHAPEVHADMDGICTVTVTDGKTTQACGPVSPAGNKLLTSFAIHAVEAQPLDYVKTVFFDAMLSFGFPRIAYPGAGTTYYYSFHVHYVTAKYDLLPPNNPDHEWIPGGTAYQDWLSYGHQAPGTVHRVFALPILLYQRVVFTWGPLLAVIFLLGLGGLLSVTARRRPGSEGRRGVRELRAVQWGTVRLHWAPRGTTMLPWVTAVALLVAPIVLADFDYRYLIPAIPFACLAAGLSFAPRRAARDEPPLPADAPAVKSTVPDQVA